MYRGLSLFPGWMDKAARWRNPIGPRIIGGWSSGDVVHHPVWFILSWGSYAQLLGQSHLLIHGVWVSAICCCEKHIISEILGRNRSPTVSETLLQSIPLQAYERLIYLASWHVLLKAGSTRIFETFGFFKHKCKTTMYIKSPAERICSSRSLSSSQQDSTSCFIKRSASDRSNETQSNRSCVYADAAWLMCDQTVIQTREEPRLAKQPVILINYFA
jgi:hypothetical protein